MSIAAGEARAALARAWLLLATGAVAASSLFAILIVMARVPGLGALFPGPEFYRVALTLHVDLSQWVWFMAFAALLWTLARDDAPTRGDWLAWFLALAGALLMAASPLFGAQTPVMANYLPVLDHGVFLVGLAAYGLAVAWCALAMLRAGFARRVWQVSCRPASAEFFVPASRLGLTLAAAVVVIALAVLLATHSALAEVPRGLGYFELLFWGPGHYWQFCLVLLMMCAWLGLVPAAHWPGPQMLAGLFWIAALPVLLTPLLLPFAPQSAAYGEAMTWLMRWATWPAPLVLALWLIWRMRPLGAALVMSFGLLAFGIVLGTRIDGQNTIVTAHYHGTIGAVTVAFMACSFALLPRLGWLVPGRRAANWQLGLYSAGIALMMCGLAGAGWMGAPRKIAGNVGFAWNVETISRLVMGVGGLLATLGILMYLALVLRQTRQTRGELAVGHG